MPHIKEGDEIGARFLNNHDDAWEWWRRFKARGEGGSGRPAPVNFSKVMAANYTDPLTQIHVGDVCEFDGNPFSDSDPNDHYPDPRNDRWLKAVTPDTTRIGWGIALDPIPGTAGADRAGGEFLVLGVCHAKVVIQDEDHEYAERKDGVRKLQSTAAKGPVKILHKPAAASELPEERLCLVQIMDEGGDVVDIVKVDDTGGTAGHFTFPNEFNLHPGRVKRYSGATGTWSELGDCWLKFVDDYDNLLGNVPAINGEWYGPARYCGIEENAGETSLPVYVCRRGEFPTEIVVVNHTGDDPPSTNDVVEANANGYHPGSVSRFDPDTNSFGEAFPCWIKFVHELNGLACQGAYYGPARYTGLWDKVENEGEEDETHDKRPVYILENSERDFEGKFDSSISAGSSGTFSIWHSHSDTDSGINKTCTVRVAVTGTKRGAISLVAGVWIGTQTEC